MKGFLLDDCDRSGVSVEAEVERFYLQGHRVDAILYDHACKLLAVARAKSQMFLPRTERLAKIPIILDDFHRNNHTWCLREMPEVDCKRPENLKYVQNVNSQACEQFHSFMTEHTPSALEMSRGRYAVYWWALCDLKNMRQLEERVKNRKRFVRGYMQHNPDVPRSRPPEAKRPEEAVLPV